MLNFDFLAKGLGIVSTAFCVNMVIAIVYEPDWGIINFEINLIFLIKLFFNMTKNLRKKFEYLENEKSFLFFIIFKGFQLPKIFSNLRVHI